MTSSPVFHTMFTNPEAEESRTGVVKITQFHHPEPMRAVLRFCYLGTLDNATMDGEWATEIFELADKFRIDDLKALLEKHFIDRTLNVENVVEMAALADSHSAPKLMEVGSLMITFPFASINAPSLTPSRPASRLLLARGRPSSGVPTGRGSSTPGRSSPPDSLSK